MLSSFRSVQTPPIGMNPQLHHRYHELLLSYWNRLRGERDFPRYDEINPETIADIWQSCFLISIDEASSRFGYRYDYMGRDLIAAYGNDVNSPDITSKLLASSDNSMARKLKEVLERMQPVVDESDFTNACNDLIKYRSCMLPLGERGQITHVLGCMRWKVY